MCGILGIVSLNKQLEVNKNLFSNCLELMNHRGPDHSGIFFNNKTILGHKRLSIIDLSKKGSQPMYSSDKNSILIYNGEIYNFKELRKFLIIKGFKFISKTDSEVLLNGLIYEGIEFLKRCNGMFAFAFYNKKKNEFLFARDRLGIKPFFYCKNINQFIFSSNIKSIYKYNNGNHDINPESVSAFFSFRQPLGNKTFYKNINSLDPGNYIQIKNNKIIIKEYWSQKKFFLENKIDRGEKYYLGKIKELLNSSVNYRLISDVKVASLLSGGLDSSLITTIMKQAIGKNSLAFSIGYDQKYYNEFEYSSLVAKQLDIEHRMILSNAEEYFDDLDELINLRGQPLTIPNEASQYRLCKEIKKEATVVLSGSGADELFCGYGKIFSSAEDYKKLSNLNILNFKDKNIFLKNVKLRYGKVKFKDNLDHFLNLYKYTKDDLKKKILSKNFDHQKIENNFRRFFQDLLHKSELKSYLDKMQFIFQKYHLKGILEREDNSSMASSMELRVPFLDHRLVEFAATIPNRLKILDTTKKVFMTSDISSEIHDVTKYILKKSYEDHVPKKIYNRKKIGFPVPLHAWMKQKKIKDRIFDTLLSSNIKSKDYFDKKYLNFLLTNKNLNFKESSKTYQNSNANKLWMCYNLEKFFSIKI
jgi:asparagine synthase (glutamine-hydrolysing)